jgi:hypothetical protein
MALGQMLITNTHIEMLAVSWDDFISCGLLEELNVLKAFGPSKCMGIHFHLFYISH